MKYSEIIEKMIRLSNQIDQVSKTPHDYGTGQILHSSEIHMIEAIRNHENVNASELASILGITNGAINQVTGKLVKKGYIEQYHVPNNRKEAYYRLTDLGEIADAGHNKNRQKIYRSLSRYLDGLSQADIDVINTFIDKTLETWSHDN
jgi:DNA-binding MarR family transcriptional regulator